jgi:hypothetical protein
MLAFGLGDFVEIYTVMNTWVWPDETLSAAHRELDLWNRNWANFIWPILSGIIWPQLAVIPINAPIFLIYSYIPNSQSGVSLS